MDPRAGRPRHGGPRKFFAGVRDELTAFAAHQFYLAQRQADGKPRRAHLEAAAPHSKSARAELEGPPLPAAVAYLWELYFELAQARGSNGFGANPVSWQDLDAWQRVSGIRLTHFERSTVFALDRLSLTDAAEEIQRRQKEKPKDPPPRRQP